MSILRFLQRTAWHQASTDDASLPGLPKEENVYAQNRYYHVTFKVGLSDMGDCSIPDRYKLAGISRMKLHRELNITQKSAWHLLHRLRKAYETGCFNFQGPVEVDEAYFGGKE